jgi:hypothetical protein
MAPYAHAPTNVAAANVSGGRAKRGHSAFHEWTSGRGWHPSALILSVGGWLGWRFQKSLTQHKPKKESHEMNNQFDELTKSMAQSVTRRAALKKFGVGLAGMALAAFVLANKAQASRRGPKPCITDADCPGNQVCRWTFVTGYVCWTRGGKGQS